MISTPEQRLEALNLILPKVIKPAGNLLGFKIDFGQVYVSGRRPLGDGVVNFLERVGDTVSQDDAYSAANLAGLNVISQLYLATENLSRVEGIIKVSDFVSCAPDFTNIPSVVNGASDPFVEVFGERRTHSRCAIGVAALPRGVPVEIEVVARLRDNNGQ
ncbi:RidA family protein [Rhizobium mongolense]|uniref:RidA family protein n=1 Tax=Rhizobium mongolense TaxID=57676 RepID=UPI0034A50CC1